MLTHFNIMSNIQQVSQVFMLDGRDKILGILPFFHSFGFMAALWMPATNGVGVVYHPNPLDAQVIGELVEKYRVTFLIATPTFLQAYMRRCSLKASAVCNLCWSVRKNSPSASLSHLKTPSASVLSRLRLHRVFARSHREWPRFPRTGVSPGGRAPRQDRPPASRRLCAGRRSGHRRASRAWNRGHAAG